MYFESVVFLAILNHAAVCGPCRLSCKPKCPHCTVGAVRLTKVNKNFLEHLASDSRLLYIVNYGCFTVHRYYKNNDIIIENKDSQFFLSFLSV